MAETGGDKELVLDSREDETCEVMDADANEAYWDQLIKDDYRLLQDQENQIMGKGRRAKREVSKCIAFTC